VSPYAEAGSHWAGKPDGSITRLHTGTQNDLRTGLLTRAQLAERIRTGCVYDWQPPNTFGLLVTRDDPRTRWRARPVLAPVHAQWALFAPSIWLLTGHATACRARRCRGLGRCRGHMALTPGWTALAAAYRAELEGRPLADRFGVLRQVLAWLHDYPSVTILSFERAMPKGDALLAWEQRGEFVPWAQRHIFREWLVSLLPLAGSAPGAGVVTRAGGGAFGVALRGGSPQS
jgi:hypothetical protein